MKVLIQRVKRASVEVDSKMVSQIGKGILAFVGVEKGDTSENVEKAVRKHGSVRIDKRKADRQEALRRWNMDAEYCPFSLKRLFVCFGNLFHYAGEKIMNECENIKIA